MMLAVACIERWPLPAPGEKMRPWPVTETTRYGSSPLDAGRSALVGDWRRCHCPCGEAHPDDMGVCDGRAVMTRQLDDVDVRLCAPCAVAQGVAEMAR
jgi:hypothetical protein